MCMPSVAARREANAVGRSARMIPRENVLVWPPVMAAAILKPVNAGVTSDASASVPRVQGDGLADSAPAWGGSATAHKVSKQRLTAQTISVEMLVFVLRKYSVSTQETE